MRWEVGHCRPTRTLVRSSVTTRPRISGRDCRRCRHRGGLGAALVGSRLVTLGGESPTSVFNTVEVLDLTTNTWTTLPPMKTARHGMAVLAAGNTVYAIDGALAPGHTDSVSTNEAVDLSSFARASAWRGLPSDPTARQQVGATVSRGVLWIFGGLTNGAATNKVEGYDPTISTWAAGPSLPFAAASRDGCGVPRRDGRDGRLGAERVDVGCARVESCVRVAQRRGWSCRPCCMRVLRARPGWWATRSLLWAGRRTISWSRKPRCSTGTKWTDVAAMPTPRDHLAAAANGRYFYAVGGRALSADKNLGAVERYDPAANQWTRLPALPTPRGGLGAALVGSRLVTLGGESPTSVFNTVEVLDLTTNTWTTLPPMKTARHGMAVLAAGNTVYAIDGALAPGHTDSVSTNEAVDVS